MSDANALKREYRRRKRTRNRGEGNDDDDEDDEEVVSSIFQGVSWKDVAWFLIPTMVVLLVSLMQSNPHSINQCEMSTMRPKYKEIHVPLLQRYRKTAQEEYSSLTLHQSADDDITNSDDGNNTDSTAAAAAAAAATTAATSVVIGEEEQQEDEVLNTKANSSTKKKKQKKKKRRTKNKETEMPRSPNEVYHHKYRLLRYLDHFLPLSEIATPYSPIGSPVLFIHGHLGNYQQVRSLGGAFVHAAKGSSGSSTSKDTRLRLDYYTVDWGNERTALAGDLVMRQAQFVNDAVRAILELYGGRKMSVMVVGHSYGGMVARAAFLIPSYIPGSITDIITLGTSHTMPPFSVDLSTFTLYSATNALWHRPDDLLYNNQSSSSSVVINAVHVSTATGVDGDNGHNLNHNLNGELPEMHEEGQKKQQQQGKEQRTCGGEGIEQAQSGQCIAKDSTSAEEEQEGGDKSVEAVLMVATAEDKVDNVGVKDQEKVIKEGADEDKGTAKGIEKEGSKDKLKELLEIQRRRVQYMRHLKLHDVVLISISGGEIDDFAHVSSSDVSKIGREGQVLSLSTEQMNNVMFPVDHLALMWCKQLINRVHWSLTRLAEYHIWADQRGGQKKENNMLHSDGVITEDRRDGDDNHSFGGNVAHARLRTVAQGLLSSDNMKAFDLKGVSSFGMDEARWGLFADGADLGLAFAVKELFRARSLHLWLSAWVIVSLLIIGGVLTAGLASSPSFSSRSASYSSSYSYSSSSSSQHQQQLVSVTSVTLPANHLHWAVVKRLSRSISPSRSLRWVSAILTVWLLMDILLSDIVNKHLQLQQDHQLQSEYAAVYDNTGGVGASSSSSSSSFVSCSWWLIFALRLAQGSLAFPRQILSRPFASTITAVTEATHLPALPAILVLYALVVTGMLISNGCFWLIGVMCSCIYGSPLRRLLHTCSYNINERLPALMPIRLRRWLKRHRLKVWSFGGMIMLVLLHVRWSWAWPSTTVPPLSFRTPSVSTEVLILFLGLSAIWYALAISLILVPVGALDSYKSMQEVTVMSTYQRLLLVIYLPVPILLIGMQTVAASSYFNSHLLSSSASIFYTSPPSTANMVRACVILIPTVWTLLLARLGKPFPTPSSIRDYVLDEWRRVAGVQEETMRQQQQDYDSYSSSFSTKMNGSSGSKSSDADSGSGGGGSGWGASLGGRAAAAAAAVLGRKDSIGGDGGVMNHGQCPSCFHEDGGDGAIFVETSRSSEGVASAAAAVSQPGTEAGGGGSGDSSGNSSSRGGGGGGSSGNGPGRVMSSWAVFGPTFRVVACDCPRRYPLDRQKHCEFCCCNCQICPGGDPFSRSQSAFPTAADAKVNGSRKTDRSGKKGRSTAPPGDVPIPDTATGLAVALLCYVGAVVGAVPVLTDASWSGFVLAAIASGLAWCHVAYPS